MSTDKNRGALLASPETNGATHTISRKKEPAIPPFPYKTPYGHFSDDGTSYIVTRPDTPRPWVNVMSTGTYGAVVSQAGSGFSWLHHASLNRLNRWNQDLVQDEMGRYIYIRDEKTSKFWSVSWQPVKAQPQTYECMHGVGYSIISSENEGIQAQWLVFVPHEEPLEIWRLRLRNVSKTARSLTLWTYLEWNMGDADPHREFQKSFIETSFHDDEKIIIAKKRLSPLKNAKGQPWNRTWDHVAWHAVHLPTKGACGDKEAFLGNGGTPARPAALKSGRYVGPTTHKWDDAAASLCVPVQLKADEERSVLFTLGAAESQNQALVKARKFMDFSQVDNAWGRTEAFWDKYLSAFLVETPEKSFDLLVNTWLKYQTLSGRLWGRTGYYQPGGAYGFRDQLQDSQIFLPMEPEGTRKQIQLHAAHQFTDGTVYHWWHPLSEEGQPSQSSDDLLWLPFVLLNYLKETFQWPILTERAPFARRAGERAQDGTIFDHATRAIEKALTRRSSRGLPLIGAADWNDGLSAAGWEGKGESVWMAHFLFGILIDWAEMTETALRAGALPAKEKARVSRYRKAAEKLKSAVNKHGWDGEWYWGATTDDGAILGGKGSKEGKIFLNSQTWAILNGVVDSDARQKAILRSLEKNLYSDHGPLLLAPAYTTPDERIGYITRYSPGTRENGGVYTHAAVWALQMECHLGRAKKAWEIYQRLSPPLRSAQDPALYRAEPYVTPGNSDGPATPTPGRAGWTWYTGSSAWLYRVMTEWILGIRPTWKGLIVRPCLPPAWNAAKATREFQGATYRIIYKRDNGIPAGSHRVSVNGKAIAGDILPAGPGKLFDVHVNVGPAR